VIALEMQGHGHSPYSDREMTYAALADDVAAVMNYLNIDSADVVGYSFGGTIAYQLAIAHLQRVKKLIVISTTYKSEGRHPEMSKVLQSFQPDFLDNTPLRAEYVRLAPDSAHWKKFMNQMVRFVKTPYNLGDDKIKFIKSSVLIIMGDNDGFDKEVLIKTYQRLGGDVFGDITGMLKSQLAILPGKNHVSLMMDTKAILATMESFLNPTPEKKNQ
jgi:pimeloyl-ACP methyl ester carboxylesterase